MGNLETKPSDCSQQPWWSIENETFQLNQPNISEIFASISEPAEIKYPTVREKILAKLRDRKYSASSDSEDQSAGENHETKYVSFRKCDNTSSKRCRTESEPTTSNSTKQILLSEPAPSPQQQQQQQRSQSLDEFREELRIKRLARQDAINDIRTELHTLREQLIKEREINRKLHNGEVVEMQIEKKDAAINTEEVTENLSRTNCNSDNNSNSKSSSSNNNDHRTENIRDRQQIKESCDIHVQTDEIQLTNLHSHDNECDFESIRNEMRITRSPSDTQQINLKAQLAELQLSLQLANADNLSLTTELAVVKKQVASLKEVIACSRQMINVREEQVQQLKTKLRQIEESLADRELRIMSENLRQEYDRQLANIRNLRQLYEERARVSAAERENLLRQIQIKKDELAVEILKVKTMEERISNLENELTASKDKLNKVKEERDDFYVENKNLKEEMAVINKLFSQMLTGFSGTDNLDIDRLTMMLEENRTLLNEMATKESNSDGATLPKLLFDIVNQANKSEYDNYAHNNNNNNSNSDEEEIQNVQQSEESQEEEQQEIMKNLKVSSAQEIIGNLPKVWRILIEFLNHQKVEQVQFKENGQNEECYKFVQTPSGMKSEISVSKTYLKLKDLILEKKSLMKETNRLKTLNSHLERRLDEQEKRLSVVSLELTKTWHLVGKMQRQHRQLHTHEQILRYQLQQKKRLLNELKEELEYCRRKWAAARAKNAESQLQCDDLRKEFALRKIQDANNSAESGYSDGPGSSDEEPSPTTKKSFKEFFDTTRKIERTQSISPDHSQIEDGIVRCSSAPLLTSSFTSQIQNNSDTETQGSRARQQSIVSTSVQPEQVSEKATAVEDAANTVKGSGSGAVPKQGVKNIKLSRGKKLEKYVKTEHDTESLEEMFRRISGLPVEEHTKSKISNEDDLKRADRVERIQKLEEQCKSLIAQVIETSDNREKLEIQICQFQAEVGPAQHPIPFEEYLAKRRSSAKDITNEPKNPSQEQIKDDDDSCLTPREAEYTSKRSERLKRLEEESNQLMSKIQRTTNKGNNMKTLLDKIHSRCVSSREGSFDSSQSAEDTDLESEDSISNRKPQTGKQNSKNDENKVSADISSGLTPEEEAYTARRSERLKRLEEESKLLMTKLSKQYHKGKRMNSRIDALHLRYGSEDSDSGVTKSDQKTSVPERKDSQLVLDSTDNKNIEGERLEYDCEGATALLDDKVDDKIDSDGSQEVNSNHVSVRTETATIKGQEVQDSTKNEESLEENNSGEKFCKETQANNQNENETK